MYAHVRQLLQPCSNAAAPAACRMHMQVGDGILGTSQGVLRGLGRQAQLMLLNVACFWCVGVPAGWYLTFKAGWGLEGLWVGMASGCFLAAGTSLVLMLLVNWQKEQQAVEAAQEQVRAQSRQEGYGAIAEEDEEVAVSLLV
jgi:MATE family multidrug resistance protein